MYYTIDKETKKAVIVCLTCYYHSKNKFDQKFTVFSSKLKEYDAICKFCNDNKKETILGETEGYYSLEWKNEKQRS